MGFLKKLKFGFSRNLNVRIMKFYFDNFCCRKFKACSRNEFFCLPLRKDILRRICPVEMKFSGFVVLSKFCTMNIELFQHLHFVEVMH